MAKKYKVPVKNPTDIKITTSSDMKFMLEHHEKFTGYDKSQILEKVYMKHYVLEDEGFIEYLEKKKDNLKVMAIIEELRRVKRAFELLEEEEKRNSVMV
ncbi:MAG: hypothetical protein K0Q49_1504 [Haloplasmataceae bacterium]|jgi:hypothetical protein|nr:hypothetical protein [Haloplasmataceae bacterium]